ncbi:MAG: hypothetical protein JXA90_05425 [Planctomycetes bacterium]|nr:hypothetical protein [Planctomycetota bacterium]
MHPCCRLIQVFAIGLISCLVATAASYAQEEQLEGVLSDSGAKSADDGVYLLEFQFEAVRMIRPTKGPYRGRVYWYMLYTIENRSDRTVDYFLSINAYSDRDKRYSDMFLPGVERAVEEKLGRPLWGQTNTFEILAGRDPQDEKYNYIPIKAREKRRCVAILSELDPNANKIRIEVVGLSNDTEEVKREDGSIEILERVLVLHFERRGDEYGIDQDPIYKGGREWIKKPVKIGAGTSGDNSGES